MATVTATGEIVRRRIDQNLLTALIGAAGGFAFGHWAGNRIAAGYLNINGASGQNDVAVVLSLVLGVLGFLLGIGALNYPIAKVFGREPAQEPQESGFGRYLRFTTDHKVVGMQYLFTVFLFFFTAGLLAMGIRTELLYPTNHIFGPGTYIEIVGEHGTMMMMMASSAVVGPLGNYLVPLMIGSRRTAFPRIEAMSFWLFASGYLVILTALPMGGFPTGWTGYAPLQTEAVGGMDSYLVGFIVVGLGMILAGFNLMVTIIHYRAPGMSWTRVPIFVWAIISTCVLLTLATPTLAIACYFGILDRTALTAFYVTERGGSSFLWENLFWFFGHPEVYIMALPGFGIVGELVPVFTRKPLFAYKVAAAGMIGVTLLSFFVWQHHLFDSGIDPDMRPLFMLTTELISVPTGFIFLVILGSLWKARIRLSSPMLFCMGMILNFLIGGISGVFLSDVPVDVTLHGSFFVMAHFHYTIMGGLIFALFAGVYYWTPKLTGRIMNERWAKIHFYAMFAFFNLTFFPLFIVGMLGQPRRVFEYAANLQVWNDFSSVSAFCLGASFLIPVANFAWNVIIEPRRSEANPWKSYGLEWKTATPVPYYNFDRIPIITNDPYHYGEPDALPVADIPVPVRAAGAYSAAGVGGGGGGTREGDAPVDP